MENLNPKRKYNKWLVFTSMPFQMCVTIYLFFLGGSWMDQKFEIEGEWWTKGLTMLGVVVSLYHFIKQANYISKND